MLLLLMMRMTFKDQFVHLKTPQPLRGGNEIGDIGPRLAESADVPAYGPSCCTCLASWSSQGGLNGWMFEELTQLPLDGNVDRK